MNRIKSNFILSIILLALLSTIFFITSCSEKEESPEPQQTEETVNPEDAKSGNFVTLPAGFENNSDKQNQDYLESLNESEIVVLQENFKINSYLNSIGKDEDLGNLLTQGETFLDIDLTQHLNEAQLANLSNYDYSTATDDARGYCWYWLFSYCAWTNLRVYRAWFYCWGYWGSNYWFSSYGC